MGDFVFYQSNIFNMKPLLLLQYDWSTLSCPACAYSRSSSQPAGSLPGRSFSLQPGPSRLHPGSFLRCAPPSLENPLPPPPPPLLSSHRRNFRADFTVSSRRISFLAVCCREVKQRESVCERLCGSNSRRQRGDELQLVANGRKRSLCFFFCSRLISEGMDMKTITAWPAALWFICP